MSSANLRLVAVCPPMLTVPGWSFKASVMIRFSFLQRSYYCNYFLARDWEFVFIRLSLIDIKSAPLILSFLKFVTCNYNEKTIKSSTRRARSSIFITSRSSLRERKTHQWSRHLRRPSTGRI